MSALDDMSGVLPLIAVSGVAVKMTDSMFGKRQHITKRVKSKKMARKNKNFVRKAHRALGI